MLQIASLPDPVNLHFSRNWIGLPPRVATPRVGVNEAGEVTVNGIPIAPNSAKPTLVNPSNAVTQGNQPPPRNIVDSDNTGDAVTVPIVFAGAGENVAVKRPQGRRTALLIQNLTVVGNIFYCFDRTADNVTCIAIGPGGNRDFDRAVPQGDLHIFSSGAGTVVVEVINK